MDKVGLYSVRPNALLGVLTLDVAPKKPPDHESADAVSASSNKRDVSGVTAISSSLSPLQADALALRR